MSVRIIFQFLVYFSLHMSAWVASSQLAASEIIFQADFNASTPIDELSGVTNNASVANLDAGTAIGSWALAGPGGQDPGAIVSNPGGTDFGFAFDAGISGAGSNRVQGHFTQPVIIGAGDTFSFEFDVFPTRQGGVGENRQVRIALTDSGGTAAGSRAYVLLFDLQETDVAGANKGFRWLDSNNSGNNIAVATGVGFQNANVDTYQTWAGGTGGRSATEFPPEDDGKLIRVKLDVLGQPTTNDSTGAFLSIDWNSNGVFDVIDAPIGPRDLGVAFIDRFELFYDSPSAANRGAYFDNIRATAELSEPIPGDFVRDGAVDGADFLEWQRGFGTQYFANDLEDWSQNFGTVAGGNLTGAFAAIPEPGSLSLVLLATCLCFSSTQGRRRAS